MSPLTRQQPVVVVGAGLAGMTAALDLVDAGREVVVLEARDRVGGRVFTHHFDDTMHAELGGESIDDNHAAFLAREGGKVGTDCFRFLDALNAASAGLDPEHPERFERAVGLDATTLDEFIIGLDLVPEAEFLVRLEYRGEYNAEPADLSMLFIAQQNEGEDPGPLGVETMRITGGNSTLTAAMAAALGDRIQLARDDSARIAAFGAMLDEVFPEGVPLRTERNATMAWANEVFTGGGYAIFRPGQMVPFWPVLREGRGRIRFAGEHTEVLIGYMESAIRSGHRVAVGILAEEATVRP